MVDCAVVGGGLIGLLTALELRGAGLSVTLLDRGEPGRESSWAGGGILSPLHPWRYPDSVTALARWSQARYPDLAADLRERTGVDPEWEPSGLLVLDPGDDARDAHAWARRFEVALQTLDRAGLHGREPAVAGRWGSALWLPDVAQVRNPRLIAALRRAAEAAGVEVRVETAVQSVRVEAGRAVAVQTTAGVVAAGAVVVASGAWTPGVLGPYGSEMPIEPVRGQMLLFRADPGVLRRIVLSGARYLVPRRDGRVLAGSTLEHVGFDKSTTAEARADLFEAAVELVPGLADYPVERHWAGLRPGSPAGIPVIAEHPEVTGLFANAGHFRNGIVLGPASARLLADLILGRAPILDPAPYRWPAVQGPAAARA
jgi:glycine oxidase